MVLVIMDIKDQEEIMNNIKEAMVMGTRMKSGRVLGAEGVVVGRTTIKVGLRMLMMIRRKDNLISSKVTGTSMSLEVVEGGLEVVGEEGGEGAIGTSILMLRLMIS